MPDDRVTVKGIDVNLDGLRTDSDGNAVIEDFSDFRRHFMGTALAEGVDEVGYPRWQPERRSVFIRASNGGLVAEDGRFPLTFIAR